MDLGQADRGGGSWGWGAWRGLRPELEVGVCHLRVVEFVETYGIAWVRRAEKVEFGVFLGNWWEWDFQ